MAKPASIPLSTPDGEVRTYACGLCLQIHAGVSSLGPPSADTRARLAQEHLRMADMCCTCRDCGKAEMGIVLHCAACEAARSAAWEAGEPERRAKAEREEKIREEAMAKSLDRDAAICLYSYMSNLSEDCYCAGWMMGLEFSLWRRVVEGPGQYGMGDITGENVAELKRLSDKAGGWIVWREDVGQLFVPMSEWLTEYERQAAA